MSHERRVGQDEFMSQQTAAGTVPQLTLGWRLRMALEASEVSVQSMATQLGVSRATLSRWMGDKGKPPTRAYVAQWALITRVPVEWLRTGEITGGDGPDGGGASDTNVLSRYISGLQNPACRSFASDTNSGSRLVAAA